MTFKKITALSLVAMALSACGGGGGGGGGGSVNTPAENFVDNLNYDDPLEVYYLAKDPTLEIGVIIVEEGNGTYWAADIDDPDRFDFYDYDLDFYLDESFQVFYTGDGYYEDVYGNLYEKTTEVSKDLEKVGAVLNKARSKDIGEQLAANYGLSEERGIELGNLLVERKELKRTRALTASDENRFIKAAAGSDMDQLTKAYEKFNSGETQDMDALIKVAAEKNGTTPEHVRDLFGQILNK